MDVLAAWHLLGGKPPTNEGRARHLVFPMKNGAFCKLPFAGMVPAFRIATIHNTFKHIGHGIETAGGPCCYGNGQCTSLMASNLLPDGNVPVPFSCQPRQADKLKASGHAES